MAQESTSVVLEETMIERDLGVHVDNKLHFDQHIEIQCGKANKILGLIRCTFSHIDKDNMIALFTSLIRPIIEYGHVIYYPLYKKSALLLENLQRRATRMIPSLSNKTYESRLEELDLQSLYYRRDRGDMIECHKHTHGLYDIPPLLKSG